ncbi:MAG: N-acetylneuraminate synthase family protein [Dehalococcoidia bacterium]|jgi:N-acetylneuraminate synthase/sialic acid synthase|nr:N-acetylneuraminate synthase family protein [Dehalococcoidia bacterium]
MPREINLDNQIINDNSNCFVIAEIGNNHQGELENAKKLITLAKQSGVSAVKFQKRDNVNLFTEEMFNSPYTGPQSFGPTYGEHRMKLELSENDFKELIQYSKKEKITFFATPFDIKSAEFLHKLGTPAFKIASLDLNNLSLLKTVAEFNLPTIISTGATTLDQVKRTYDVVSGINNQIAIMQCTSEYPAKSIHINLNVIKKYRQEFPNAIIGYSGHDFGTSIPIAAFSMGARIIEKHFTNDKTLKGTDHQFSLTPNEMASLIKELHEVKLSLGDGEKIIYPEEQLSKFKMGKKLVASKKLNMGHIIQENDISIKSPGDGISPFEIDTILGKTIKKSLNKDSSFTIEHLE